MRAIELALEHFSKLHDGRSPTEIVVTRNAILALGAGPDFKVSSLKGIPVRIDDIVEADAVEPGAGTRLGMFVNDNGVQVHVAALDLR